jgi:hypothetical protein
MANTFLTLEEAARQLVDASKHEIPESLSPDERKRFIARAGPGYKNLSQLEKNVFDRFVEIESVEIGRYLPTQEDQQRVANVLDKRMMERQATASRSECSSPSTSSSLAFHSIQ